MTTNTAAKWIRTHNELGDRMIRLRGPGSLPDDFSRFYRAHFEEAVRTSYAILGDRSSAEDAATESMWTVCDRWDEVGSYDRPDLWLRRVVINRSLSLVRKRKSEDRALRLVAASSGPEAADPLVSVEITTGDLRDRILALPPRQMEAIVLVALRGLSIAEAAEVMETRSASVRVAIHRARKTLAKELGAGDARHAHTGTSVSVTTPSVLPSTATTNPTNAMEIDHAN